MNNILDIFYDYTINCKLLDRNAISKILDILLKENNVDNQISYIICKSTILDTNILGEYDMNSIIYIYYWEMLKKIRGNKFLTKFDRSCDLNKIEITAKKNIYILETIFHEIEHVKQQEMVKNINNKTIEAKLYQYEMNFMNPHNDILDTGIIGNYLDFIKRSIKYNHNYQLSFMERMANINTYEKIILLLNKLGIEFQQLLTIQHKITNNYITDNYEKELVGPTTRFICNLGYNSILTKEDLESIIETMNFNDRLRYGFMITQEEYKKVKK